MGKHEQNRSNSPWRWLLAVLAGLALGGLIGRFLAYLRRVLSRPLLAPSPPVVQESTEDLTELAHRIALRDLLSGLEVRMLEDGTPFTVLCAGVRNFREPWARDTGFAMFGLLELDMVAESKEALQVFLRTQNESGQFPVKIHSTSILDRYLHSVFGREQPIDQPIRPKFITAHNTISLDGNALLIIAILNYARRFDDLDFAAQNWGALLASLDWLDGHASDADWLLHQGPFTDWADTVSRTGKVLYTNVIYWKALREMEAMSRRVGHEGETEALKLKADRIEESIQESFWRPDLGYFVTSEIFDNLSSSGNLLAIAWGLADPDQSNSILDVMRYHGMAVPVPTKAVHLAYPREFIAIENRLGGIADYHTYFAWLWLGAWHVLALLRCGRIDEAGEVIYNMSRVIVRDGAVHEVYRPDGMYASTIWYTSESPLTWSAGMFVYAYRAYIRYLEREDSQ